MNRLSIRPAQRPLSALLVALGAALGLSPAHAGISDPPANDNCVSAFPVQGGIFTGATVAATIDGAACAGSVFSPDVWYSYTAPGNGTLNVDTCGSDYDTVLSIHSGCPGNGGNLLVCNDDACGTTGLNSSVSLPVTSGTTYLIRVSGFAGSTGNYILNIDSSGVAFTNDSCANAFFVDSGTFTVNTSGFNTDGSATCADAVHDAWWSYTATGNGTLNLDTCGSDFDTVLSVHSGCPGTVGNQLACDDDACGFAAGSRVSLAVTKGTTYLIRVAGFNGSFGGDSGNVSLVVNPVVTPENDDSADAFDVGPFTYTGSTATATTDGSTICGFNTQRDVWYRYTATGFGTLNLDTCGSDFDTVLSVHSGCPGTAGNQLACSDDNSSCGFLALQSALSVPVTQGATYLIRVSGYDGLSGNYTLHVNPSVVASNDACAFAYPVGQGTFAGSTSGASNDGSTSCGGSNSTPDVWYAYTAEASGTLFVDTCGSGYDTVLSVHSGCPGNAGNTLVCNDDACGAFFGLNSSVSLGVTGGTTYLIRISGFGGSTGNYTLNISQTYPVPANNDCASAVVIGDGVTPFTNLGATTDGSSDGSCSLFGNLTVGSDLWYRYTPSCTGTATVSTCGSDFDTMIAVYPADQCPTAQNIAFVCNDDSCGVQSNVAFPSVAGNTYLIRVGGYSGDQGTGIITIGCTQGNDDCADAFAIGDGVVRFDTSGTTTDGPSEGICNDVAGDTQVQNDIWYAYTASCTGTVTASLCGSAYDTKMAAYASGTCPASPGTAIACNDDSCGLQSQISFSAIVGNTYLIRIGGYFGSTGAGRLTMSCSAPTCPADYNQDGVLNADDIADFITGYFNLPSDPATDFNADGVINADDLGDFITAYFNGCP